MERLVEAGPAKDRIVAVRQGNLLATSFHPEVTGDHRVHAYFVEMTRAALGDGRAQTGQYDRPDRVERVREKR